MEICPTNKATSLFGSLPLCPGVTLLERFHGILTYVNVGMFYKRIASEKDVIRYNCM